MKYSNSIASILLATAITAPAMTFVHPGALENKAELDFVKAKIAAGAQPWTTKFNQVKVLATATTNTEAPADGDENGQKSDARKAYANALAWYFTGTTKYAEQAIGILNLWGNTFAGYTLPAVGQGNQAQLDAGWIGALLGPAAEIMRGYSGWKTADIAIVQNMFKTKFYPALNQMSPWNGNVDLTQIDAMMNLAVFNEDEAEFNAGLARLKKRDSAYFYLSTDRAGSRNYGGSSSAAWSDASGNPPEAWVDGLTQETCRDNDHHSQYAMASAFHAAEVAWHQGVDVYTADTKRYTAVLELMALQITSGSMQNTCTDNTTTPDRFDTWEIGYNHYHNRKGIDLPNTLKALTQEIRTRGASDWNIFFETLTHAEVDAPNQSSIDGRNGMHHAPMTIFVRRDGTCDIAIASTESVEVSAMTPSGVLMSRSIVAVKAGENRSISLGLEDAPAGVYLVRARSAEGISTIKFSK